jgi:hypothetical protein
MGIAFFVLLGIFIVTDGLRHYFAFESCAIVSEKRHQSPDGKYDVRVVNQYCAGGFGTGDDTSWITIRELTKPGSEDVRIFESSDDTPDVSWISAERLLITVLHVCRIGTSLHRAGDVMVVYRIGERLSEEKFREKMEEYERNWVDNIKNGRATFTGHSDKDAEALRHAVEAQWAQYRRFKEWAAINAENGGI